MSRFRIMLMTISFLFLGHLAEAQVGANWTQATSVAPVERAVSPCSRLVRMGRCGCSEERRAATRSLMTYGILELSGTNWTQATTAAAWSPRYLGAAVSLNGRMWILGGLNNPSGSNPFNDVWSSVDGTNWTQVTGTAPWGGRYGHAAVVFNGMLWVLGGNNGSLLNDVWSSVDGTNWTQVTSAAPWGARCFHTAVVINNLIWVFGGYNGGSLNDVWSSSDGLNWTQVTSAASWSPRYDNAAVALNGQMWILGGNGGSGDDVWSSTNGTIWTQVTSAAPWSPRYGHAAVALNGRLWSPGRKRSERVFERCVVLGTASSGQLYRHSY